DQTSAIARRTGAGWHIRFSASCGVGKSALAGERLRPNATAIAMPRAIKLIDVVRENVACASLGRAVRGDKTNWCDQWCVAYSRAGGDKTNWCVTSTGAAAAESRFCDIRGRRPDRRGGLFAYRSPARAGEALRRRSDSNPQAMPLSSQVSWKLALHSS